MSWAPKSTSSVFGLKEAEKDNGDVFFEGTTVWLILKGNQRESIVKAPLEQETPILYVFDFPASPPPQAPGGSPVE